MKSILKGSLVAAVFTVAAVVAPTAVAAWGEHEYTGNGQPQFNIYTDVPNVGNERDFLTVGADGANVSDFSNNVELCEGEARLSVYVHNGAPESANGENNTGTGVAKDTKLNVQVPNRTGNEIKAVISASNAATVTDGATVTCDGKEMELEYVKDSATIFSQKRGEEKLADAVVNSGTLIGTYADDGVIPGCWDFRVYVSLKVRVKELPVTPEEPETPETPEQPKEEKPVEKPKKLPSTGAGSIVSLFGLTTVAGTAAHYVVTRRRN